jgi:2,3,4,5-tetrahydropyridine-2-carboxylate N-succinyltransferase
MQELQNAIESGNYTDEQVKEIVELVDQGKLRVASKIDGQWQVNTWVKQALLANFPLCEMKETQIEGFKFRDKWPLKQNFKNVRIVPGGNSVRYGAYLADNVVMMPPAYINLGAYVDEGTMIDSNALVGSCAQIGKNVHLSAGVQIGGVLEPANATPVIIEDKAFLSAGVIVVEGVIVEENAVLAPGVIISASTKIIETDKEGKIINEYKGRIPANAIVIPGARQRGEVIVQTPIIIGYKNEKTAQKLELTDFLRDF